MRDMPAVAEPSASPTSEPGIGPTSGRRALGISKLSNAVRTIYRVTPFGSNVTLTLGCNIATGLCALITGPLCARLLGPAGRGELAAIQNLYWLVTTLAMLGLPEATLYFTARKVSDPRRILVSSGLFCLIACPIFYAMIYPLVPAMLAAQAAGTITTARWILLGMPLYVFAVLPQYSLRGQNDLIWWNIARMLPTFGWLFLLLVLSIIANPTPALFATAYLGMFAIALIPIYIIAARKIPGTSKANPNLWPPMLKYGIPLAASAIPIILNLRLDQMLLAAFMPARSLGIYVVAVSWSSTVPPALLAIGSVLFPRVAAANENQRRAFFYQGTRIGTAMAILLSCGVATITPFAIRTLFGKSFVAAIPVSLVLVFAASISGLNIIFEEGLRGLGQTKLIFWSEMSGLVVTIASLAILLRSLGIMGAGIASVLGYFVTLILLSLSAVRSIGGSLIESLVIRASDWRVITQKVTLMRSRNRSTSTTA